MQDAASVHETTGRFCLVNAGNEICGTVRLAELHIGMTAAHVDGGSDRLLCQPVGRLLAFLFFVRIQLTVFENLVFLFPSGS